MPAGPPFQGRARAVNDALTPWRASYDYYNLTETPAEAHAVLPPASYHRLQQIKTAHDPAQAIISTPSGQQQPRPLARRRQAPWASTGLKTAG